MIERFSEDHLVWINLKNPTADEVHSVMDEYAVPPMLVADLTTTVPRSYATSNDGIIKIVFTFPVLKSPSESNAAELKFIIGKRYLITTQYTESAAVDRFKKQFEVISALHKTSKSATGAHLFIALVGQLYEAVGAKLDYLESNITKIEMELFTEKESQLVTDIAEVSRNLIAFRHVLQMHDDIYHVVLPLFDSIHKHAFVDELEQVRVEYHMLIRRANSLFESITALHDTNIALLTTKQNDIMKRLTIMAFVTFPLALFSSLFSMKTVSTPLVGMPGDFWVVVGIMAVAISGFFAYFSHKRWM